MKSTAGSSSWSSQGTYHQWSTSWCRSQCNSWPQAEHDKAWQNQWLSCNRQVFQGVSWGDYPSQRDTSMAVDWAGVYLKRKLGPSLYKKYLLKAWNLACRSMLIWDLSACWTGITLEYWGYNIAKISPYSIGITSIPTRPWLFCMIGVWPRSSPLSKSQWLKIFALTLTQHNIEEHSPPVPILATTLPFYCTVFFLVAGFNSPERYQ